MTPTPETPHPVDSLDPAFWSALVDGELSEAEWRALSDQGCWPCRERHSDRLEQLQSYHLIGDVLRLQIAQPGLSEQSAFLQKLHQHLPESRALLVAIPAANEPVFRWRAWAGLAAVASVAATLVLGTGQDPRSHLVQAPQPVPTVALITPGVPSAGTPDNRQAMAELPMMLRDPQLDQWLAAHRQVGGNSALQMPAGFLRNATFETGR